MKKKEKVILAHSGKLGSKYEVVELKKGFVINYLLPRHQVMLYNQPNLSWVKRQQDQEAKKSLVLEEEVHELYKKLNNFTLSFTLKKDEKGDVFGSVGFKEILQELANSHFQLEKSQLLDFHPLNKLGENIVKVKLGSNIVADLKIIVN